MFSIIIPVYNKSEQLVRTLTTVFRQTYKEFEVIIIDDGSTDNSVSVIRNHFDDSRLRVITQKNQGVSAARNKGIGQAQYPFIAFLDADDLWHPQYLEVNKSVIEQHPEVSIFGSGYEWIYPDEELIPSPLATIPQAEVVNNYFETALQQPLFWTSATVVRKADLVQAGLFNPTLKVGEDYDVWFRVLLRFKGIHIPAKLAWYMRSDRGQLGPGKLVPLNSHLIGQALDIFAFELKEGKCPAFNKFIYNYILSDLILYYVDKQYCKEAIALYRKIKLRYRLGRPRYVLYLLPYRFAQYLYNSLRRTKG